MKKNPNINLDIFVFHMLDIKDITILCKFIPDFIRPLPNRSIGPVTYILKPFERKKGRKKAFRGYRSK